jgi:hypothetical protein
MCCLKHLVGLPNTRDITKEDLEFAPMLPALLALDPGKQGIGIRAAFRQDWHGTSSYTQKYEQDIDNLYANERSDDSADAINHNGIPEGILSSHRPVFDAMECYRDEGNDDQYIEDNCRQDNRTLEHGGTPLGNPHDACVSAACIPIPLFGAGVYIYAPGFLQVHHVTGSGKTGFFGR